MIGAMVEKHGWKDTMNVAKHSTTFLGKNAPKTLSSILDQGGRCMELHATNKCSITRGCLVNFAVNVAPGLQGNHYTIIQKCLTGGKQTLFLKCIRVFMEYGEQKGMDAVGKRVISHGDLFSTLVKSISESTIDGIDSRALLRDILNKCLVQHSIPDCGWKNHGISTDANGSVVVPPSLHIRHVLQACPNLAHEADEDGRLTLHHATGSINASHETIECIFEANSKAASVRDPVTRLYPFMLAGSNVRTTASFKLLLADPNLVLGGTQVDAGENDKKRKRSPSMG